MQVILFPAVSPGSAVALAAEARANMLSLKILSGDVRSRGRSILRILCVPGVVCSVVCGVN